MIKLHDEAWYPRMLWGSFALAIFTYLLLRYVTAPYGRHVKRGWGPAMGVREGWVVMESPALWAMILFYSMGDHKLDRIPLTLLRFNQVHYLNRTLIYPLRLKVRGKGMPMIVVAAGVAFNVLNAYLQGRWLSHYGSYDGSWLSSPQFVIGACAFITGFLTNFWADHVLLSLRTDEDDRSYKIPRGGLFQYVTCPNYFGEMLEWLGWAIMTWSPAGLFFFVYTVANLAPRAAANHRWYHVKFNDYPKERKMLVPFLL